MSAPAKRQAVRELIAAGLSEAAACRALQISRSSFRYRSRRPDETRTRQGHQGDP